jgi:hypothetical protein
MRPDSGKRRTGGRLKRHLRQWGAYWAFALALLAASEMLWRWHTSPVREMMTTTLGAGS